MPVFVGVVVVVAGAAAVVAGAADAGAVSAVVGAGAAGAAGGIGGGTTAPSVVTRGVADVGAATVDVTTSPPSGEGVIVVPPIKSSVEAGSMASEAG